MKKDLPDLRRVIVVTGLSGAGKSCALHAFEDLGYQVVDNLPLDMAEQLLEATQETSEGSTKSLPLAVGLDSRSLHFSPDNFIKTIHKLRSHKGVDLHVLFLDASNETLVRRFSETRRRHPLAKGQLLREAIGQERELMTDVRLVVDAIIDSTARTSAETRRVIVSRYSINSSAKLVTTCMSFSYARGVPKDADLVFDVRFLRNPHYEAGLSAKTGLNDEVANFVRADQSFMPFVEKLQELMALLLPRYKAEGKSYLTIAFGCTGGKHRSVMMAEAFAAILSKQSVRTGVYHRDLPEEKLGIPEEKLDMPEHKPVSEKGQPWNDYLDDLGDDFEGESDL